MSYRTETFASGQWADVGFLFATEAEAAEYGRDLTHITRHPYRAVRTDEAANYRYASGRLIPGSAEAELQKAIRDMWKAALGHP